MQRTSKEIEKEIEECNWKLRTSKLSPSEEQKLRKQIQELEQELEKLRQKETITPRTFTTLDFWLNRKSGFFPKRELFEKNLIYFTDEECQTMREIQSILTASIDSRMFLLYGDPASGKTLMGAAVAKELEKQQRYTSLYLNLTDKTDFDALWGDIEKHKDRKILFIVDDCHLNIQLATNIYRRFNTVRHAAACLLISREIPKSLRSIGEFMHIDIFEELKERSFELDTTLDEQVEKKMSGIIQNYKKHYEQIHKRKFIVGDKKQVIQNVHRNFLTLYFYLDFWKDEDIAYLDQLDEKQILDKVYHRYLCNPTNRPYMNVFLKYAALYQYEIQFEPSQQDVKSVEFLTGRGLLEYNSDTDYYTFYHSDFARLLIKSYAFRPTFIRKHRTLHDFTVQQIKAYVLSFQDYPPNLGGIFRNLIVNEEFDIFRALLQDVAIQDQTIRFYHNDKSASNLAGFLYSVTRYAPKQSKAFLEVLTINHPSVKPLFLEAESKWTLYSFVTILKILQKVNVSFRNAFLKLFNPEEQKHIVLSSSFYWIGHPLSVLRKSDATTAKALLSRVTTNELLQKAQQSSFNNLGWALNTLKNLDRDKAKQILAALDLTTLTKKAQQVSFAGLGNALNELKNVDAAKAKQIFTDLDPTVLTEKAQQVSFDRLGNALNELKNLDPAKAKQIFTDLDPAVLTEKAQEVSFRKFGSGLSDLSYVDIEKAGEILQHLDLELLAPKILHEKYSTFLWYIPVFAQINPTTTRQLFEKLPNEFLFQFESLKYLPNFNRLLYAFYFSEFTQYAERLIPFAQENTESFLKSKILRDITSFLNLCSHYLDVKGIIEQYHRKFFWKIRFGEPAEIPYFIRVIYDHDPETALEFLEYIEQNIEGKDVLGYCFYQLASSCFDQEDYTQSSMYAKKAIPLFEESEEITGLGYTYFLLAKSTLVLQEDTGQAREFAETALSYAQLVERQDLQEEIVEFITNELS